MVQGIDQVYSLLDKQKQDRAAALASRERKNERNNVITDLLVKGGVAIGNTLLENKTRDFINSTEQQGLRRAANAADAAVVRLEKIGSQMDEHKGGRLDYMREVVTPLVTAEFNATTQDYREGQDPYNNVLQNRIMDAAKERLRIFEEAEAIYKNKDMRNFGDRLDILQNKFTDSSLSEFAVSAVSNLGKSKEDLEMEQIIAFKEFTDEQKEGTRGYYMAQLQDLVTAYNKTGDLALSSRFAKENNEDMILQDPTDEERYAFKTSITFKEYGTATNKKLYVVKQKQRMDRSVEGPEGKPFWQDIGKADISLYSDDPEFGLTELEYVQGVYNSVGFADLIAKFKIDKEKLGEYHTRLQNQGLSLVPQNKAELAKYLQITSQFLTENTSYFTEGQEKAQEELIAATLRQGSEIDKTIREMGQSDAALEKTIARKIKAGELDPETTVEMYKSMLTRQAAQLTAQMTKGISAAVRGIKSDNPPKSEVLDTRDTRTP